MTDEGIENFFKDLGLDAETDITVLLVSKYMGATQMGEYSYDQFKKGCEALGCENIADWKKTVKDKLKYQLREENNFHELYMWVHTFASEPGMKNVEVGTACALWDLFLGSRCGFLKQWKKFLQKKEDSKDLLVITKDVWEQFYTLQTQTKGDLKKFEDDGCWPPLFDEFFEQHA